MEGYESTVRAIEFQQPGRLAVCRSVMTTDYTGDVVFFFCNMGRRWWQNEGGEDEWGCRWERTGMENMGLIVEHPLRDWNGMKTLKVPDAADAHRYEDLSAQLARAKDKYCVLANGSALFERMHFLRGFAETMEDLYLNPQKIEELADVLMNFQLTTVDYVGHHFKGQIHGIRLTDDWGTQQGLMISLPLWRAIFKPRYQKIFDAVHRHGMHMWLHSCGKVNDLIGDFIDVGLDVINLEQPRLLGIEEIGKRYAGKICFETHCDIQQTLPAGDERAIRREAELLLKHWTTPRGGLILGDCYPEGNGFSPAVRERMIMTFLELDPWRKPQ